MMINTRLLIDLAEQLKKASAALAEEVAVLQSLEMKNGQDFSANLTVCGKRFHLVTMGCNYLPERVKALNTVRLELIEYQRGIVVHHQGAIEGIEFRIREVSRGVK